MEISNGFDSLGNTISSFDSLFFPTSTKYSCRFCIYVTERTSCYNCSIVPYLTWLASPHWTILLEVQCLVLLRSPLNRVEISMERIWHCDWTTFFSYILASPMRIVWCRNVFASKAICFLQSSNKTADHSFLTPSVGLIGQPFKFNLILVHWSILTNPTASSRSSNLVGLNLMQAAFTSKSHVWLSGVPLYHLNHLAGSPSRWNDTSNTFFFFLIFGYVWVSENLISLVDPTSTLLSGSQPKYIKDRVICYLTHLFCWILEYPFLLWRLEIMWCCFVFISITTRTSLILCEASFHCCILIFTMSTSIHHFLSSGSYCRILALISIGMKLSLGIR